MQIGTVTIDRVTVKPGAADNAPVIVLTFSMPFSDRACSYLGPRVKRIVSLSLEDSQRELDFVGAKEE